MKFKRLSDKGLLGLGFCWAFFEAIFWFILPDFFLAPAVISRPKLAKRLLLSVITGTMLGTMTMLILASLFFSQIAVMISNVPFTTQEMIPRVETQLQSGIVSVILQPFSGIPVKVWSYTVIASGYSVIYYYIAVNIGRIIRFLLVCGVSLGIAKLCHNRRISYKVKILLWTAYIATFLAYLSINVY